jgi:hypothetical protein
MLALAVPTVAVSQVRAHKTGAPLVSAGAPLPSATVTTAVPSTASPQTSVDAYSASVTVGSTQNDLYLWLAARAGRLVRLSLTLSVPTAVSLTSSPQAITFASGCASSTPPANCTAALNLRGARYLVYGTAPGLTAVTGGYQLAGYFHVRHVLLDQQGVYTVPLRYVSVTSTGSPEDRE